MSAIETAVIDSMLPVQVYSLGRKSKIIINIIMLLIDYVNFSLGSLGSPLLEKIVDIVRRRLIAESRRRRQYATFVQKLQNLNYFDLYRLGPSRIDEAKIAWHLSS